MEFEDGVLIRRLRMESGLSRSMRILRSKCVKNGVGRWSVRMECEDGV